MALSTYNSQTIKSTLWRTGTALLSLVCLSLALAGEHVQAAAPKQCVYSLSTKEEACPALGISGVPSYVIFKTGSIRGIYISRVSPTGMQMWSAWGLRPGNVLMEVNGRCVDNARTLQSVLKGASAGDMSIVFAEIDNNVPQLFRKQVQWSYVDGLDNVNLSTREIRAAKNNHKEESISALESHMLQLVNDDRRKNGAMPVSADSALTSLARDYAEYMLQKGFFNHVDPQGRSPGDRARARGITGVAENISFEGGRGTQADRDLITHSQARMMAEPPNQENHRSNIIDPTHHAVGIGIARNKETVMMVQEFQ